MQVRTFHTQFRRAVLVPALWISLVMAAQPGDQVYVRTNLVGYSSDDAKMAIAFSNQSLNGHFNIIDSATAEIAFTGNIIPSVVRGYGPFQYYYQLDFSDLRKTGTYRMDIPGMNIEGSSLYIDSNLYKSYAADLIAFMQQQRCGYNPFFDTLCHQGDGRVVYGPMRDATFIDVSGGWHDAGDQLKYLITGSNATARMLMAYQLYPDVFHDLFTGSGKPGANGVPDVLDEARWGLDWILKLHPAPDVLIHQVGDDRDHIGWKLPAYDPSDYSWGKNSYRVAYVATGKPQGLNKYQSEATGISNIAGRSAAAMALGYQVWTKCGFDQVYAMRCLMAAESLYRMAKQDEGYQQGNSYGAPYRYMEDTWTDDMEWAAAELFKATGNTQYLEDAVHYATLTGELSWIQKDTSAHYQYYPFLNIAHYALYDLVDDTVKLRLAAYYRNGIEMTLRRAKRDIFQIGIPFIWCSNNVLVDLILQIVLYERMTGDPRYHTYMLGMRDWLFGRNPWGTTMFTGIPRHSDYPVDVHTSTWALTRREVPGGLVDGPIYVGIYNNLLGLRLTHPDPYADFQNPYVTYHDDIGDYSTNEPTMDGTACAVMLMAYLAGAE
ncbi:MAG TPA: glycoside hydrolase family 9 protein [Saprospiraceae bacterium]|nr:glycoside hydrolase family 9 protein [Saprospiraceae bacterium]